VNTEHGAAGNSQIHTRGTSSKLSNRECTSGDGQEGVVGSGYGRGGREGGVDYEWECIYYEQEGEAVSKIIYMTEYDGVSGEIAAQPCLGLTC
jgi:hypothetical protein